MRATLLLLGLYTIFLSYIQKYVAELVSIKKQSDELGAPSPEHGMTDNITAPVSCPVAKASEAAAEPTETAAEETEKTSKTSEEAVSAENEA